jgi:photosystem I subunit 10
MVDLSSLLAAVQPTVPPTPSGTMAGFIIMGIFNLLGLFVAANAVQKKGVGAKLPLQLPGFGKNFSVAQFLAGMSFGHVLGTGAILGLTNIGVL